MRYSGTIICLLCTGINIPAMYSGGVIASFGVGFCLAMTIVTYQKERKRDEH